VPDTYQGNELPAFVLVDPDNRRQPDLQAHAGILDGIARSVEATSLAATAGALLHSWQDGRLKLFLTWRLLGLRSTAPALFDSGSYLPLAVEGEQGAHLCAYVRVAGDSTLLVVVSRWAATLVRGAIAAPLGRDAWGATHITLPIDVAGDYADVLTGRVLQPDTSSGNAQLKAAALFEILPVAVLLRRGTGAQFEQQQ
jgi:(1->4)-alpha-D-glucan 1-alpha-D-glucosylmutase